jgi:hypothetical protein
LGLIFIFHKALEIADGHLTAVMKDKGAERAKEVLNRKVREHKSRRSFLCKV